MTLNFWLYIAMFVYTQPTSYIRSYSFVIAVMANYIDSHIHNLQLLST